MFRGARKSEWGEQRSAGDLVLDAELVDCRAGERKLPARDLCTSPDSDSTWTYLAHYHFTFNAFVCHLHIAFGVNGIADVKACCLALKLANNLSVLISRRRVTTNLPRLCLTIPEI